MTDAYVVDASVAVKLVIEEHDSAKADRLLRHRMVAPDLIWSECANILWKCVRRGIVAGPAAALACDALLRLPFEIAEAAVLMPAALRRAVALDHPAYDCLYLELAARRNLPLVTADRRLSTLAVADVAILHLDALG
jgi:predicted nucleic acid-binding protein